MGLEAKLHTYLILEQTTRRVVYIEYFENCTAMFDLKMEITFCILKESHGILCETCYYKDDLLYCFDVDKKSILKNVDFYIEWSLKPTKLARPDFVTYKRSNIGTVELTYTDIRVLNHENLLLDWLLYGKLDEFSEMLFKDEDYVICFYKKVGTDIDKIENVTKRHIKIVNKVFNRAITTQKSSTIYYNKIRYDINITKGDKDRLWYILLYEKNRIFKQEIIKYLTLDDLYIRVEFRKIFENFIEVKKFKNKMSLNNIKLIPEKKDNYMKLILDKSNKITDIILSDEDLKYYKRHKTVLRVSDKMFNKMKALVSKCILLKKPYKINVVISDDLEILSIDL